PEITGGEVRARRGRVRPWTDHPAIMGPQDKPGILLESVAHMGPGQALRAFRDDTVEGLSRASLNF
ncbi:MAG: hypothetical protein ABW360_14625, partial [Phenylobacterium sp.]